MQGFSLDLKQFLDEKYNQYNQSAFVDDDPISIPHRFSEKDDIEISALLTALISWGNRKSIIKSASRMMDMMDNSPGQFVKNASENEINRLSGFYHRTFNGSDLKFFVLSLRSLLAEKSMEELFVSENEATTRDRIIGFRKKILEFPHEIRVEKHLSDPERNSAAKRINMFLRWMVRKDKNKVDFGVWTKISPACLMIPLDLHSGNTARKLGILNRKQNDWKAVEELTCFLRTLDPDDPVKYDFALFGLGIFEKF